jgi:hypothetical protein
MISIHTISLILAQSLEDGLASDFGKPKGQRCYGFQEMRNAREYKDNLVGTEQHMAAFGTFEGTGEYKI